MKKFCWIFYGRIYVRLYQLVTKTSTLEFFSFHAVHTHACNAANDEYLDFNCNCNYKVFHQAYFPLIYYGHPYTYTFPINFCCLVNVPSPIINHREYIPWCMSFILSYAIMLIKWTWNHHHNYKPQNDHNKLCMYNRQITPLITPKYYGHHPSNPAHVTKSWDQSLTIAQTSNLLSVEKLVR